MNPKMQPGPPTVSVVMCVYNGERFLREAVESILNQTFTNFEFIIVDDGSTDNSWQILTEYATQDDRIVLIRNQINIGISRSANRGLARVRGKYIARTDADDISLPNRLGQQVNFLESHPEIGVLGGSIQLVDGQGNVSSRLWQLPEEHGLLKWRLCFENPFVNVTVMMRRDVVIQTDGYHSEFDYSEDYDLWQRLSNMTRLAHVPDVLAYVRRFEGYGSNVSSHGFNRQYQHSLKISQRMMSEILGEEVPLRLVKKIIKHFDKPEFDNANDVCEVAHLVYRLCRAYMRDPALTRQEKRLIRKDAAKELYLLYRPHVTNLRAWKMLGWACRLEPFTVGRVLRGRVWRRLVRVASFLSL